MPKHLKAAVTPALLRWARESAGFSVGEAAAKVPTKPERLESWESGDDQPTINQLRKLGVVYKRPIAVFYLAEPPRGWAALRDFRRLPGEVYGAQSPRLRMEIRRARTRREVAIELYQELGEAIPEFEIEGTIGDNPSELAESIREALGVSIHRQFEWKGHYEAYNGWREAIENRGILIFQASRIEVGEMRGFCVSDKPLPVIGVNSADSVHGRIFSVIHELVHIALSESGISDLVTETERPPEEQAIEVFCNQVAAEILVPSEVLSSIPAVKRKTSPEWDSRTLAGLSRAFGVSKEVILRRLVTIGKSSHGFYELQRDKWAAEYTALPPKKGGPVPQERLAISSSGRRFTQLVLNSYYREVISVSDVSGYLNLRVKHFGKLENELWGRTVMFKEAV